MNWAAIVWLGLMIVFLIAEAASVSLVSLWFAAGALVAMIVSLLGGQLWLQIVLFVAVSAVLLGCLRPLVRKFIRPKTTATNIDAIVGSQGYITADVDNLSGQGQVKLGAMEWSARSSGGEPIPTGTLVQVDRIEGVKVYVSTVKVSQEV